MAGIHQKPAQFFLIAANNLSQESATFQPDSMTLMFKEMAYDCQSYKKYCTSLALFFLWNTSKHAFILNPFLKAKCKNQNKDKDKNSLWGSKAYVSMCCKKRDTFRT